MAQKVGAAGTVCALFGEINRLPFDTLLKSCGAKRLIMKVGLPKETKNHEYRVGLTPSSVQELVIAGHKVSVEAGAGHGAGFEDDEYIKAGAAIVADAGEVFAAADMIVKVKELSLIHI